ncbi:SAM-dependent methyltransferase [Longibacter salinarum]|uniref:SAM-dependent methyltransferase n=1 Tax=Longibacter salinarum TaxID=1850348 RepID=A0A2A8CVQ7_9BACT|nr:class I SAM-dependent methyltransferase [Longibacter salinarum]PEN12772.1 SAM-dependent methyltransferase [Longibacter salinarum]
MAWYDTWFGSEAYELVYQHRDDDEARTAIDLVESCADPEDEARILDVGCGRGRHTLELARRGYNATGIDLSKASIEDARSSARDLDLKVHFDVQDMREPFCDACMDGVVNLFTTFGYFEQDDESERAIRAMTTSLRPGGFLIQDFLNPPYVRETLVEEDRSEQNDVSIRQRRWIEDGRVHKRIDITEGRETRTFRESVRLFTRDDFEAMYNRAGLELQEVYGDYDGSAHTENSPRTILYSVKR